MIKNSSLLLQADALYHACSQAYKSFQLQIIIKLPSSQQMQKDFVPKAMGQSYLKNPSFQPNSPLSGTQSFYHHRPSTNYIDYSPNRMNHSFIGFTPPPQQQPLKLDSLPPKHSDAMRSCEQLEQKENARMSHKQDTQAHPLKVIEQRMLEVEKRLEKMEKHDRKADLITKNVEELMQMQLKDIKANEELEERLNILEEMMTHLKTTKLDRKQLQSTFFNTQPLQTEISQLWKQDEANKAELKDNKQRIHKLVNKIQTSVLTIGSKYEEFIESNIIKSIEHVNKLAQHYHEEIETFKNDYMKLKDQIQAMSLEKQPQPSIHSPPCLQIMQISIPNIKIVQSISIINEKKESSYASKDAAKDRYGPAISSYKNNLLNSLYDSIEKSTESSSAELLLEKVLYKLDREYYLLDENDHYLVDAANNRVRLTNQHIKILEENGLIQ